MRVALDFITALPKTRFSCCFTEFLHSIYTSRVRYSTRSLAFGRPLTETIARQICPDADLYPSCLRIFSHLKAGLLRTRDVPGKLPWEEAELRLSSVLYSAAKGLMIIAPDWTASADTGGMGATRSQVVVKVGAEGTFDTALADVGGTPAIHFHARTPAESPFSILTRSEPVGDSHRMWTARRCGRRSKIGSLVPRAANLSLCLTLQRH